MCFGHIYYIILKAKGLDDYILPLTGKAEQQQFTMQTGGVLTNISSRQCSAISGHPLPGGMDWGVFLQIHET